MKSPIPRLSLTLTLAALMLVGCNQTQPKRSDDAAVPEPEERPVFPAERALATATTPAPKAQVPPPPPTAHPVASKESVPAPAGDLWVRIRDGFRLTVPANRRVDREVEWYASHPEYLGRIRERARPYLRHIVDEIEQRGLPMELALLPVVESAYQPFAYSPGRAAGLWQFIPSTGKHFNLKQNWWYDGRRDVIAATDAALDYLQSLARRFGGDWELALAAYNSGAGTVSRAIKRNRKRGKPTDYWSLKLPRETQSYVPRLLAISKVVADPPGFGLSLAPLPDEPYFREVDIQSQLDLALAAEMAGVKIDQLYRLNPGFNRWATDPDGPHRLVLPVDKADQFDKSLAALSPNQRVRWLRYRIRKGDNLGAIAGNHHTTVELLKEVNGLKSSRIRAGKYLLIPAASRDMQAYALSAGQRLAGLQGQKRKGNRSTYRVRPGDSLWKIARRLGVNHKGLAKWNGMAPKDTLRVGSELVVWRGGNPRGPVSGTSAQPIKSSAPVDTLSRVSYRVSSGDSLYLIARKFNVQVKDLKRWNTLSGKYLQPGQQLKLYVDVAEQSL